MIRRSVAGLVLGVALLAGSLAWSGFVALNTVLDPGRSQDVADELYEDGEVRDRIIANVARSLEAALPEGVEVTDEQLEAVAARVFEDPAVEALITDAFVDTHAAFLGEGEAPSTLDAGAVGEAARRTLVELEPALDAVLPPSPELVVDLPTERVPDAGPLRRALQAAVPVLAMAAVAGVVLSLITTTDRPSVLRRAGVWAISSSAFVLVVGIGLPWLVRETAPEQATVVAALISALLRSTLVPAIVLAASGVAALLLSVLWPLGGRSRDRRRWEEPAPPPPPRAPARAYPSPAAVRGHQPVPHAAARPRPVRPPDAPPTPPSNPVVPAATAAADPVGPPAPRQLPPQWVEGVGWVQHPMDEAPPSGARWVAGVGYVFDDDPPPGPAAGQQAP